MLKQTKQVFDENPNEFLKDQIAIKNIETGKWNYFENGTFSKYDPTTLYILKDDNSMQVFSTDFNLESSSTYHLEYYNKKLTKEVQILQDEIRLLESGQDDLKIGRKERKNLKILAKRIAITLYE